MSDDSDWSDAGNVAGAATNVLLGYASREATDDTFSQLGGSPLWPIPSTPPSSTFAQCGSCKGMMRLLLQLDGDLAERFPGHTRRLYIFTCPKKACRRKNGSIRALRGTKVAKGATEGRSEKKGNGRSEAVQQEDKTSVDLGGNLFNSNFKPTTGSGQNPFASGNRSEANTKAANPFSAALHKDSSAMFPSGDNQHDRLPETFADKARISSSSAQSDQKSISTEVVPWPPSSAIPPPYPSYHLDADYEILDPVDPAASSSQDTKMHIDSSSEPSDSVIDKEAFESSMDKAFQTFADRLAQNPEQILRYEFGGNPLLYSRNDAVGQLFSPHALSSAPTPASKIQTTSSPKRMQSCPYCGASRVFELQLTPHAITELEAEEEGLDGMDWGTVILGVCSRDCCEEKEIWSWKEEWAGVQWEELGETKGKAKDKSKG